MTTILHIDSSILGSNSASRSLTAEIVAKEVKLNPGATLLRRDLVDDELQHLSPAHLAVFQGNAPSSESLGNDIALGGTYIDELFSADIIIIGVPMYNFSIPGQLKAWLDRVLVAGRTFHYTANGPEGLLPAGKKVYVASTRGGVYSGISHRQIMTSHGWQLTPASWRPGISCSNVSWQFSQKVMEPSISWLMERPNL
ncbi:FMN-dependent NADH-azoreductase 1 [compost metagenome]